MPYNSGRGHPALVRRSIIDRIFLEMQTIKFRISDIEKNLSGQKPKPLNIAESKLIALPDNLRRTYLTVASKGECDATQVSNQTGRSRAIESNYLNQLTKQGWLSKHKLAKKTLFNVPKTKQKTQPALSLPLFSQNY